MRVTGILSFLSFCDVCSADCLSICPQRQDNVDIFTMDITSLYTVISQINLNSTVATLTTLSAQVHPAERNFISLQPPLIPFIQL